MKMQPKTLVLSVAVALGVTVTVPANAFLTTPLQTVSFSGSASVTDTCNTTASTSCSASPTNAITPQPIASASLNQFDISNGVLVGTSIKIESTRTQTLSGTITNPIAVTKTISKGSSNGKISAPGADAPFSKTLSLNFNTFGTTSNFTVVQSDILSNATLNVGEINPSLVNYVDDDNSNGIGTVALNLTAPSLFQATSSWSGGTANSTSSSATYKLNWSGKATADYNYREHASGAISTDGLGSGLILDLDFGSVFQFSTPSPLEFFISNAASSVFDGDRVGLDLDSVTSSGDDGVLTTELLGGIFIGAGTNQAFQTFLDTSNLGIFNAQYILNLSDEDVGAENSRYNNYQLTLNLSGKVIENPPPPTIPEPGSLALLGMGLIGLARKRRKAS